jgi:anti-sigma factor RsiW
MIRLDCGEVADLIPAYSDEELPPEERRAVDLHLAGCPDCSEALAKLTDLKRAIRGAATFTPPTSLEARVRAAIGLEAARTRPASWGTFARLAASHLLVAALAALLAWQYLERTDRRELAIAQLVSAHVRSTLAAEPVQIASSDQHTVRPWFTGRLDYAPPVRDLTGAGFPLIGARLDHVLGRTAAALVYGRRKHRINVFVLPGAAPGSPLHAARDGFNIVGWQAEGFHYWAVSDLNRAELEELAGQLKGAAGK